MVPAEEASETIQLLESLLQLARSAGDAILDVYHSDFLVRSKEDSSPVTEADIRAEEVILAGLRRLSPGTPVVAEESVARTTTGRQGGSFWLVDPLDGTREFINRNGEFTVNIALVSDAAPVLGVVLAPALDVAYVGAQGHGAWEERSGIRRGVNVAASVPAGGPVVVSSRSHEDESALRAFLGNRPVAATRGVGSSLKFCLVATGEAQLYPRLGPTMEWDTAAGHAVLAAAGGDVVDLHGLPLCYGKPGFRNPAFVARCPAAARWQSRREQLPGEYPRE